MRIPSRLRIHGREWTIRRPKQVEGGRLFGTCDPDARVIEVEAGLRGDQALETFLHEVVHASLPREVFTDRQEEIVCYVLAETMLDVVKALSGRG